jgi:ubiquitin C-terminal hydrolase
MKRHFLSKIPNYLIVSIKRFQYSVEEKKNQKIMSKLNIRSSIRLKGEDYDIYSLIIHRVIE